ncbi:SRPBCC domain-containing protein [Microbacterium sp. SS28]|uniref:SRPBCC domain-containing protein n=1 Tax=Microbacterium sp. SS28 TaxID=2919948 RepID=UPI001FAA3A28|nr:SRPBCC domain-containing protein [Microbacterium sp. SS28]
MTAHRTGSVVMIDGEPHLVLIRTFGSPAEAVWQTFTDSERLRDWIGYWEGDPTTGAVSFFMTAEGDVVEPELYTILECDRPRRFAGETGSGWHLWFELHEEAGVTTLRFGQRIDEGLDVGSIGPGWEYYLDRALEAHEGRDAAAVVWDDYFPALQDEYAALTH